MAIPRNLANLANQLNGDGDVPKIEVGNSKVEVTDSGTGKVEVTVDNVEVADFTTGEIVFNETGANQDFRVEGDTNANLIVADAGVDKVGIGTNTFNTNGGVLQVSNGISFPATQSACADANTLDDYEEGTWTPVVSPGAGGTITSLTVAGRYTKIGRQVFLEMRVNITDVGTGVGGLDFSGIPFTPSSAVGNYNIGFGKNRATGNFVFVEIFNPGPNPSIGVSVATGLDVFATVLYTV